MFDKWAPYDPQMKFRCGFGWRRTGSLPPFGHRRPGHDHKSRDFPSLTCEAFPLRRQQMERVDGDSWRDEQRARSAGRQGRGGRAIERLLAARRGLRQALPAKGRRGAVLGTVVRRSALPRFSPGHGVRHRRCLRHLRALSRLSRRPLSLDRRRPLDGATAQLDLLFLPEDSPLRRDRRWAEAA
jgi:hypothetical protein